MRERAVSLNQMAIGIDYTSEEWQLSAGHFPLSRRPPEDLPLLHRHHMWANQQREAFFRLLENPSAGFGEPGPLMMATREIGFMFTWYGLLWAVIEACIDPDEDRNVDIRGPFRHDIEQMSGLLRRCRNAVLHVPRSGGLLDARIQELVAEPNSAITLRRIHRGFGRLFLDEFRRTRQPVPDETPG